MLTLLAVMLAQASSPKVPPTVGAFRSSFGNHSRSNRARTIRDSLGNTIVVRGIGAGVPETYWDKGG
jgi:hypothetical protein